MYVVVVGCGEVGRHISQVLLEDGHDIVIVDIDGDKLARVENSLDVRTYLGSGSGISTLKAVDVDKADLYVAVSNNDEANLVGSALAKRLGCHRVITRLSSQEHIGEARQLYQSLLGIDLVVSPKHLVSNVIVRLVHHPGIIAMEDFAMGKIRMVELEVPAKSKYVFKHLKDIPFPKDSLITSIIRGHELIIPHGEDILTPGDGIFAIGDREGIKSIEKMFGVADTRARKVAIVGGGEIGQMVAHYLELSHIGVTIIEKDLERCKQLASQLNRTTVINGDGTKTDVLKEIGIGDYDAIICLSKEDEINLMSGLLAREMGVKRTIVLVHKADYVPLYESLGIDSTISPRLVTAMETLRFIKEASISRVAILEEGKAEIIESKIDRHSSLVGKPLSDIDFPTGAIVGAVLRDEEEVIIPRGSFVPKAGDRVIMFCSEDAMAKVEKMLR